LAAGETQATPTWLADGRVAYVSWRQNVSAIYAVRVDGSDQQPLVGQPPALLFTPSASRDGAATAFVSTRTGLRNIWISRQFSVEPFGVDATRLDPVAGGRITLRWGMSSSATVSIVVVDSAGHTVRTLLARSRRGAGNAATSWDGRDGTGRIVPEGAYSLRMVAQAPGLPPLPRGVGVTIDEVSLHGTLQVRALLAGRPAASVTLSVYRSSTGMYVTQTVSDSNGTARLSLAAGSYTLLAQTASGASASVSGIVLARRAMQRRTVVLTAPVVGPAFTATPSPTPSVTPSETSTPAAPTSTPVPSMSPSATAVPASTASPVPGQGTLTLTVVLAPGKPAANAAISVLQGEKVVVTATSDSAGNANLPLRAGQYTVNVSLEAATGSLVVTVIGGTSTARVIDLQAGMLVVMVQQANGQPAADTSVYFLSGTKAIYDTGTNSDGQAYAILPAGSYTIQAGLAPHDQTATVRIAAGVTTTLGLKLK